MDEKEILEEIEEQEDDDELTTEELKRLTFPQR